MYNDKVINAFMTCGFIRNTKFCAVACARWVAVRGWVVVVVVVVEAGGALLDNLLILAGLLGMVVIDADRSRCVGVGAEEGRREDNRLGDTRDAGIRKLGTVGAAGGIDDVE